MFCLSFITKSMVISEGFLTSGLSGSMPRLFLLFLPVNCGSIFNFKESGMDEFLSVKNLLIVSALQLWGIAALFCKAAYLEGLRRREYCLGVRGIIN